MRPTKLEITAILKIKKERRKERKKERKNEKSNKKQENETIREQKSNFHIFQWHNDKKISHTWKDPSFLPSSVDMTCSS